MTTKLPLFSVGNMLLSGITLAPAGKDTGFSPGVLVGNVVDCSCECKFVMSLACI